MATNDYRQTPDRRKHNASPFSLQRLHGRRRKIRRDSELRTGIHHLDWYDPRLFLIAVVLMLLCIADAHNTIQLIGNGAEEANPAMRTLLHQGTGLFLAGKLGLTSLGLVLLVAYHNHAFQRLVRVRHILYSILVMYVVLVAVQVSVWDGEGMTAMFFVSTHDAM